MWLGTSESPVPADPNSGLHVCFTAPTRKSVDAFHKAALASGGRDNGKPGLRKDYGENYYAAFVIDPDGYRIEAYCSAEGLTVAFTAWRHKPPCRLCFHDDRVLMPPVAMLVFLA